MLVSGKLAFRKPKSLFGNEFLTQSIKFAERVHGNILAHLHGKTLGNCQEKMSNCILKHALSPQ